MLVRKYIPKNLDEIVGQEHVVKALKKLKTLTHMLFVGQPGVGKTSVAYALANERKIPIIEFNASDERGINVIREKIKRLAFSTGTRIILLDEADNMTSDAQHALRRIMEKSQSTIFILTANEEWKIIDPIKSRCMIFRFRKLKDNEILKIIVKVLKGENMIKELTPELKKGILYLVKYVDGDARKALNMLETLVMTGRDVTEANIKLLIPPNIIKDIFQEVYDNGDFAKGLKQLEDILIENKLNIKLIIKQIYESLEFLDVPLPVKIRLYDRLAEVERGINMGCTPIIQLASFLASLWVYKYAPKGVENG